MFELLGYVIENEVGTSILVLPSVSILKLLTYRLNSTYYDNVILK